MLHSLQHLCDKWHYGLFLLFPFAVLYCSPTIRAVWMIMTVGDVCWECSSD